MVESQAEDIQTRLLQNHAFPGRMAEAINKKNTLRWGSFFYLFCVAINFSRRPALVFFFVLSPEEIYDLLVNDFLNPDGMVTSPNSHLNGWGAGTRPEDHRDLDSGAQIPVPQTPTPQMPELPGITTENIDHFLSSLEYKED